MINITLSADENLIEAAHRRAVAEQNHVERSISIMAQKLRSQQTTSCRSYASHS